MARSLTDEEVISSYELYSKGVSSIKLQELYGVHFSTILRTFQRKGFKTRNNGESHRKYNLNEYYFDNIDTKDKAYFLGLLYSDGCNHVDRGVVSIGLQDIDVDILNKFNTTINSSKPLFLVKSNNTKRRDIFRLTLNSHKLSNSLYNLGCINKKAHTIVLPIIDDNLMSHFIRGFLDGDGHISKDRFLISITASKTFIYPLVKYLNQLDIKSSIVSDKRSNTTTSLRITSKTEVIKFINYLYKDADIYLNRKYETAISKL